MKRSHPELREYWKSEDTKYLIVFYALKLINKQIFFLL